MGTREMEQPGPESETEVEKYRQRNFTTGRARNGGRWTHGWADRPPSASARLTRPPHLLGKPPTAAAATIKPDSSGPCSPLFSLPPPVTPAIISLVQNELLQLQPRQLCHLGASAGTWWLGPRGMPLWAAVGRRNRGMESRGHQELRHTHTHPSPWAPTKARPPYPASPGGRTPRAFF